MPATVGDDFYYDRERAEDNRSAPLKITYTLAPYKKTDYKPRLAHKEVGYQTIDPLSLDRVDKKEHHKSFIMRHDLQKSDPKASVSEVKEPIVFYLYNIPDKYKESVKKGILNWNPVFEKIGYKNALVVKDAPTDPDWDHANGLQNVVLCGLEGQAYAGAILQADPFSGQIFGSTFHISLSSVEMQNRITDFLLSSPDKSNESKKKNPLLPKNISEQFHNQDVEWTACHEVGHCLGLRHNYLAQAYYSIDQIKDEAFVKKNGLTSSVMSYPGQNIFALQKKRGVLYQTTPGLYDYYAIEYGYKPLDTISIESEKPHLKKVVQQMRNKNLSYMTDEDGYFSHENPYIATWTLSAQPIEYAKEMYKLLKDIREHTIKNFLTNRKKLSENTLYLIKTYDMSFSQVFPLLNFIGGFESSRLPKVLNINSPIAKPISSKLQKEVLDFAFQVLEDFQANNLPESVLFNLKGAYTTKPNMTRAPDIFARWNGCSHQIINALLSVERINKILSNQFKMKNSKDALKLDEYYSIIQSHVFANKPLTLMRKQLHRAYISELIETINAMQKPKFQSFSSEIESRISGEKLWFSFNTEAQISAEKQLTKLQNQIKIKSFNLTTEEEADHYNNLLKQINAFLNRKTVKPVK